jgi:hypothetical protein
VGVRTAPKGVDMISMREKRFALAFVSGLAKGRV